MQVLGIIAVIAFAIAAILSGGDVHGGQPWTPVTMGLTGAAFLAAHVAAGGGPAWPWKR